MRFMLLLIPGDDGDAMPDTRSDAEAVAEMVAYHQRLHEAGVLVTLDGLHPPSAGARVSFAGGEATVIDGPFDEAPNVLGGYWMIEVASREDAIAWATRCPAAGNEVIEVRQVQEFADFPPELQRALTGELDGRGDGSPATGPWRRLLATA